MTLQRYLVIAFLVFLLGVGILHTGVNRVPFRNSGGHEQHKSSLLITVTVASVADYSSERLTVAI